MNPARSSIPEVPGWPYSGAFPSYAATASTSTSARVNSSTGNTVSFRAGPLELFLLSDPADVHVVLVERAYDFHKSPNYAYLRALLGTGLLTSEDELHKRQRRLMAPSFTPRQIGALAETFVTCAERLQWRRRCRAPAEPWPRSGVTSLRQGVAPAPCRRPHRATPPSPPPPAGSSPEWSP